MQGFGGDAPFLKHFWRTWEHSLGEFQNSSWWDFYITETSMLTRFTIKSTLIHVRKLTFFIWVKMRIEGKLEVVLMAGCVWCSLNANTEIEWWLAPGSFSELFLNVWNPLQNVDVYLGSCWFPFKNQPKVKQAGVSWWFWNTLQLYFLWSLSWWVLEKQTSLKGNCHLILDSLFWSRAADPFIFPGSKWCLLYVESSRMCCQPTKVLAGEVTVS